MTRPTVTLLVALAAVLWYILGQIISFRLRRKVAGFNSFPTIWSDLFYWLALLGTILILGIGLFVNLTSRVPPT